MIADTKNNNRLYSTKQLIQRAWEELKINHKQVISKTLLGIIVVLLDLAFVWVTKMTIDIATGASDSYTLKESSLILILIIFTEIFVSSTNRWIQSVLSVKSTNRLQRKIFSLVINSDYLAIKNYHSGDLINRIEKDSETFISAIINSIPDFVIILTKLIGAFFLLFFMDKNLAYIIIFLVPFFLILSRLYVKKMRILTREIRSSESRIQALMQENIQNSIIIKTLQRIDFIISKLSCMQDTLCQQVKNRTHYSIASTTIMSIGFATGYLVTFLWGTTKLSQGAITYGALLAFIQLVGQIQGPARNIMKFIPIIINAATSCERIMEIEKTSQEVEHPSTPLKDKLGIKFENVCFNYVPEKQIIKDFSYTIPPCSKVAIMGETGTGKTTLIKLILALLSPTQGMVSYYDENNSVIADKYTRKYITYVPQGNTLFSGTIRENLLLGNPNATQEQMEWALRLADAKFVFQLKTGLDTQCNEGGTSLSEGQAQRICIARALLKDNNIIFLDEATSALDSQTELNVIKNICTEFQDKTIFFISHRPAILDYCTQVLNIK